jgi:anti-sigma-K factor RskA
MVDENFLTDATYLLGAEYALGLLEGDEAVSARLREASDPAFRALVAQVRTEAGSWIDNLPEVSIREDLWSRIEMSVTSRPAAGSNVAPLDDARTVEPDSSNRTVRAWRVSALMAMAASLVLAIALGLTVQQDRKSNAALQRELVIAKNEIGQQAKVAQISDAQGDLVLGAVFYPGSGALKLRAATFGDTAKVPELWVIDGTGTPRSLGIIDQGDSLVIQLPADLRQLLVDGATIAVTLEDAVGAPHAAPTGDILGTSRLTAL